jgi:hypothetical protein
MNNSDVQQKTQAEILRDAFSGIRGREPESDEELQSWLTSPEGKAALAFEATDVSRWGEKGRS